MKLKKLIGFSLLLSFAFASSACLFIRLDEQLARVRNYDSYTPKRYFDQELKYISSDGINFAYIEKGEGPTLVLLHGGVIIYNIEESLAFNPYWDIASLLTLNLFFPARAQSLVHLGAISTIDSWAHNFEEFSKHFHTIALDLPGFGNSDKPDGRYTVPEMVMYLNNFLKAKGIERATLVGHDFSGLVAIDYALTYPDKVDGLVLISPYGTSSHKFFSSFYHWWWHYPRWIARAAYRDKAGRVNLWKPVLKANFSSAYERLFMPKNCTIYDCEYSAPGRLIYNVNYDTRRFVERVIMNKKENFKTREFEKEIYATHLALQDMGRKDYLKIMTMNPEKRTDWILRVKDIKVPTLIVYGKFDPVISEDEARYLDQAIPNSMLSVYPNSAHYPMVEESGKFNEDVIVFVSGLSKLANK